jgi:hypothetical protein
MESLRRPGIIEDMYVVVDGMSEVKLPSKYDRGSNW